MAVAPSSSAVKNMKQWQCQLQPVGRAWIVSTIMDRMTQLLRCSDSDGLVQIDDVAVWFEDFVYNKATSLTDYLRRLSSKMLQIESKSLSSMENGAQSADWQDEIYEKIKVMKEKYFLKLSDLYLKTNIELEQHDSVPDQPRDFATENLKFLKARLTFYLKFLQVSKHKIGPMHMDYKPIEKQIIDVLHPDEPTNWVQHHLYARRKRVHDSSAYLSRKRHRQTSSC